MVSPKHRLKQYDCWEEGHRTRVHICKDNTVQQERESRAYRSDTPTGSWLRATGCGWPWALDDLLLGGIELKIFGSNEGTILGADLREERGQAATQERRSRSQPSQTIFTPGSRRPAQDWSEP